MDKYRFSVIEDLDKKLNKTRQTISDHEKRQLELLEKMRKINTFLASTLENGKNHHIRKEECVEKVSEVKIRIETIKATLNQCKNIVAQLK